MVKVKAQCTNCNEIIKLRKEKEVGYCINCKTEIQVPNCIALYNSNFGENSNSENNKDTVAQNKSTNKSVSSSKSNNVAGFIIIILLLVAAYFKLYYTDEMASKTVILFEQNLINQSFIIQNDLGIKEGIVNSLLVLGKSINGIFINLAMDFIHGFGNSFIRNVFWLFFGWIWTTIKACLLFLPRYFVMLYQILVQGSSISYFASYVITTLISWKVLSLFNDN